MQISGQPQMTIYQHGPISTDILSPPSWSGPPGQLLPYSINTSPIGHNFGVYGENVQVLQLTLNPKETVYSEKGAMVYMGQDIEMNVSFGGLFGRLFGGEELTKNRYTNNSSVPQCLALAPDFPARIIPVDLSRSGAILATPGMYLSHTGKVNMSFKFVRSLLAGCFGGSGFFLMQLSGTGTVFLTGGGTIMEKYLASGEELLVDTESLVAFSQTASYEVRAVEGCLTCFCGGEGFFNTVIKGPGLVVIQSMSKSRLQRAVVQPGSGSVGGNTQPSEKVGVA